MVWHLTLISIVIGLIVFLVHRSSLLALTVIFVALNALTAATGQSAGIIVTCLVLSTVVIGTQLLRTYTNLVPAMKRGDWRRALEHE
jgi:succinate dehydrogenase/fumarate reductase cytochrome b subunit